MGAIHLGSGVASRYSASDFLFCALLNVDSPISYLWDCILANVINHGCLKGIQNVSDTNILSRGLQILHTCFQKIFTRACFCCDWPFVAGSHPAYGPSWCNGLSRLQKLWKYEAVAGGVRENAAFRISYQTIEPAVVAALHSICQDAV